MADLKQYKVFKNTKFEILTDEGFKDFKGLIVGKNNHKLILTFDDGTALSCTHKHKIMINKTKFIFAQDLNVNDCIFDGKRVKQIEKVENDHPVYEFLEIYDTHKYYCNNILCHQCVVIDEGAHIPYNLMEEFWKSVIPVISSSTKSKVFMISTANGTGNKFYEVYSEAERLGKSGKWVAQRIDWWEVPGRDEKWKRDTIASLGSMEAWTQEFENSFISTGESAINTEILTKFRRESVEPKIVMYDNRYKIWDTPKPKRIYVMGADCGEGIGSTASTIQMLDITDLTKIRQVACYKDQYVNPYAFAKVLYEIAGQWGSPYLFMERNNVGGGILDTLYNTFKYEKIASYVPNNGEVNFERMGIYSHTNTKLDAVTNMRYWINELQSLEIYDIETIQEFETFVRYANGTWKKKVGENLYDDMVTGLMWGLYALKNELCERYFEILKYDDKGRPLKIGKSLYDEEEYFGAQSLTKNFNDGDPLPAFIGLQDDTNEDYLELESNGWELMNGRVYE